MYMSRAHIVYSSSCLTVDKQKDVSRFMQMWLGKKNGIPGIFDMLMSVLCSI